MLLIPTMSNEFGRVFSEAQRTIIEKNSKE
jgi:hypothetical protein